MTFNDFLKVLGVAITALLLTIAGSFLLVLFYAYLVEPGHELEFYIDALRRLAPWSSHIVGPIAFFASNYWLAKNSTGRITLAFAISTVVAYLLIDLSILISLGGDTSVYLEIGAAFWVTLKFAAAILGAHLGSKLTGKVELGADAT